MPYVIDVIDAIHSECSGQGCRTCDYTGEVSVKITDRNIHHYL